MKEVLPNTRALTLTLTLSITTLTGKVTGRLVVPITRIREVLTRLAEDLEKGGEEGRSDLAKAKKLSHRTMGDHGPMEIYVLETTFNSLITALRFGSDPNSIQLYLSNPTSPTQPLQLELSHHGAQVRQRP